MVRVGVDTQKYNGPILWLDDIREPWKHGFLGAVWAKTAKEAIEILKTGTIAFASLDHDLAWEHYPETGTNPKDYREQTGYDVICWMEEHNVWPALGVECHSMNPVGRAKIQMVIDRHYR